MPTKIYVAGSSLEIERAKRWVKALKNAGLDIVSTWIDSIDTGGDANPRVATNAQRANWAAVCLAEIRSAAIVWFLVPPYKQSTRGMWVELGFAFGDGRRLVSSGDVKQSIFCALTSEWFTDEAAFEFIVRYAAQRGL